MQRTFWMLATLAVWLLAILVFKRIRRPTRGYAERTAFRTRLPGWVKQVEFYTWVMFFVAFTITSTLFFYDLSRSFHQERPLTRPDDLATMLMSLASVIGSLPLAMLAANLVSWLVPALRAANAIASDGLTTTTFSGSNRGLLLMASVVVPLCVVQGLVGAFQPW